MLEDTHPECVISNDGIRSNYQAHINKLIALDAEEERVKCEVFSHPLWNGQATSVPMFCTLGIERKTERGGRNSWRSDESFPGGCGSATRFRPGEVCCQKTNLGFVDSVWEIFGPLLAGVPSVILSQEALSTQSSCCSVWPRSGDTPGASALALASAAGARPESRRNDFPT